MSERVDPAAEPTAAETQAAIEADNRAKVADATLPDGTMTMERAERVELATAFRRIRDAHRGRFAAPAGELPADPVRVATAIGLSAENATPEERRRLLEDLVDLQAFVADDAAGNVPLAAVAPAAPGAASDPDADLLLERIRWRQATLTAALLGHPSVLGDHNAIRGRWTPIGDARAAIDLVNDYREKQTAGIGAMASYVVAAPVGMGLAWLTGLGRPTGIGIGLLAAGWFASPYVGTAAGALEAWVLRRPWRGSALANAIEIVAGVGALIVVPVIFGFALAVIGQALGWR